MFVQIVKFRLKPDASRERLLALTGQMIAWLKERPGFVAYELYEGPESWSDRIAWETRGHADDGLQDFLATPIATQMLPLREAGHSSFFGEAVASAG